MQLADLRIFTEPQQGASYGDLLAVARRAESLGYGAFFRSDHYLTMGDGDGLPGPTDAWVTLGGIARETSTIRLGTLVTSATFRLPGPLAISVAQVDDMSNGRVELGLGAGWYEREHEAYGIEFPPLGERFDRLEEQLEIITGMWATPIGETFESPGGRYPVTASPALPKPVQSPVPIIIGGGGPKRTPAPRRSLRHRVQHAVRAARVLHDPGRARALGVRGDRPRPGDDDLLGGARDVLRLGRGRVRASRRSDRPGTRRAAPERRRRHPRRGRCDAAIAGPRPAPSGSTCRCSTSPTSTTSTWWPPRWRTRSGSPLRSHG